MKTIGKESIFSSLKQDGLFSCRESVPAFQPFSTQTREWVRQYCREQIDVTKYRSVRNQVF
ncbi:MAG TPA: hypothetical protein VJ969_04445, partial [Desulfopila sp.]|nr:hypothetical protein [Desulfopila sp.]